jgi:hypothetical protein
MRNKTLANQLGRLSSVLKYDSAATRFILAGRRLANELRFNPNWQDQPRVPRGNTGGGQWTDGGAQGVTQITAMVRRLGGRKLSYNACVNLCLPLLDRKQGPGSDINYWDFQKCMNICLGRNL